MSSRYVAVAFDLPLDKFFWYKVPSDMKFSLQKGQRVKAPFRNTELTGFIVKSSNKKPQRKLKQLLQVVDFYPPLNEKLWELAVWMSKYYLCTLGQSLHSIFPFLEPYRVESDLSSAEEKGGCGEAGVYVVLPGERKLELILSWIKQNHHLKKQTIVLVPEINLIHLLQEKAEREGFKTVVFHSKLSPKERYYRWLMMKKGQVELAIGTRSVVFAPFNRIGCIVVDQEESTDYKQKETPKYNVREVAIKRGEKEGFPVYLVSHAPSVESWYKIKKGLYQLMDFSSEQENSVSSYIVDLKREKRSDRIFSHLLQQKIKDALNQGLLVMLLVMRRGYASFLLCHDCGEVIRCPECNIGLTFHLKKEMVCHYCGLKQEAPSICPFCQGREIKKIGWGTQRVEMELRKRFPEARVERVDLDADTSPETVVKKVRKKEVDILVGTQLLVKEEILSQVDLAGVMLIDVLLNLPDFRAGEHAFQFLVRIKRNLKKGGTLIIQTYNPTHYALTSQKIEDFYSQELKTRKYLMYPPYEQWIRILLEGSYKAKVRDKANRIKEQLVEKDFKFLGPSPCPFSRIKGRYRYHIVIRNGSNNLLEKFIRKKISPYMDKGSVKVGVDVDPLFTM